MAVAVSTMDRNTEDQAALRMVSDLSLTSPTDIALAAGNLDIADFKKTGSTLNLVMEDGETLDIEDFFAIGPDGNFSRLQTASGETVVTGLMVPEPNPEGDARAGDGGGLDLSSLAGTGLMVGGGFSFFSMDDADPGAGSEVAKAQAMDPQQEATFAQDIAEMIGPETDGLSAEDYEAAPLPEGAAREGGALSPDQDGTRPAGAGQPDVEPQADAAQRAGQDALIDPEAPANGDGDSPDATMDQRILSGDTAPGPDYLGIEAATADILSDLMPETS